MAACCCCEPGRSVLQSRRVLIWRLQYASCHFFFLVFQELDWDLVFMFLIMFLQVDNAATKGASAVLIYPDTKDYNYLANTSLYGHVGLHTKLFILGLLSQSDTIWVLCDTSWFCVCSNSGPSGFRRPLHSWVPLLQPHPVLPNWVVWPPKNPSPDHHRQHSHSSSTVRPPTHPHTETHMWRYFWGHYIDLD